MIEAAALGPFLSPDFPIIYESHALDFWCTVKSVMPAQLWTITFSWVNIREPNQLGHI